MSELEALKQENNELKGLLKKAKALMLNSLNNSTTETKECFIASRVGCEAGLSLAMSSPAEPKSFYDDDFEDNEPKSDYETEEWKNGHLQ